MNSLIFVRFQSYNPSCFSLLIQFETDGYESWHEAGFQSTFVTVRHVLRGKISEKWDEKPHNLSMVQMKISGNWLVLKHPADPVMGDVQLFMFPQLGFSIVKAGFNGQLVVRIRTIQVWIGVTSSVLGMFFFSKSISGLSTYRMYHRVSVEDSVIQSFIRDKDLV